MPFTKEILGIDVGSHTIRAFEISQTLRGLAGGKAHEHPTPDNPEDLPETLQHFVEHERLDTEQVVCSIAGERISLRRLEFPFRDAKKLGAAIPFAVEGEVPFELNEVVIDWMPLEQTRHTIGNHGAVVIAALTPRAEVSRRLLELQSAKIEPRILEAEGLVLGNLASVFELSGNRLLIDLGHKKTTMCLMSDGRAIQARTVPIGGLAISQAIAKERGCSLEEAEEIKYRSGREVSSEGVLPEALPAINRICREIARMLEASHGDLATSDDSTEIGEITIMGGTSKLHGIADAIYENIGVGVHPLGDPLEGPNAELIRVSRVVDHEDDEFDELDDDGDPNPHEVEEIDTALYAHAIALALRGSPQASTDLNFRQDEFAYRTNFFQIVSQDLRPTAILAAIAAGLAFVSFGTSLALESSRASALEKRSKQLYSEVMPGSPSNPVPALSQALRAAQDRADFLGIYATDLSAVDLLAELSRRIPKDVKVKFEDINIDRRVVKIKVLGDSYESADRLKSLLAKSAPFMNAEVAKVKTTRGGTGKSFNLTLNLGTDGDAS